MRCSKSNVKREVHCNIGLPQDTRKISNKQPNLPANRNRKRTNKTQSQQKEENNKDQRGNKIEIKNNRKDQ